MQSTYRRVACHTVAHRQRQVLGQGRLLARFVSGARRDHALESGWKRMTEQVRSRRDGIALAAFSPSARPGLSQEEARLQLHLSSWCLTL
eukprot:339335-Chlamydomonas_euryale.AAC.1